MPVNLSAVPTNAPVYSPTWFSRYLKGDGGSLGPVSADCDPAAQLVPCSTAAPSALHLYGDRKAVVSRTVPVLPCPLFLLQAASTLPLDDSWGASLGPAKGGGELRGALLPQSVTLLKKGRADPGKATVAWAALFWRQGPSGPELLGCVGDQAFYDPSLDLAATLALDGARAASAWGAEVARTSLHQCLCRLSREFQANLAPWWRAAASALHRLGPMDWDRFVAWVGDVANYRLHLADYVQLDSLVAQSAPTALRRCRDANMALRLAGSLKSIGAVSARLPQVPSGSLPARPFPWSREQAAAVCAPEPVALVQAGAGTGKSTVILGRIDYLVSGGVAPADVLAVSFTNAAANHLKEKRPGVRSSTIASLVHTVYEANWPGHAISDDSKTLRNLLALKYSRDKVGCALADCLLSCSINRGDSYAKLAALVEENFDEVMAILDECGQTTLDLESVVVNSRLGSLKMPDECVADYLIVDETQDCSIFDFCVIVTYCHVVGASLYIVGDANQTLYQFRGADADALNALEASGVFGRYSLNTNYRSHGAVLSMANRTLERLPTNRFARIELRPNSLVPLKADEVKDRVRVIEGRYGGPVKMGDALADAMQAGGFAYLESCVARGESVCVLAGTHRDLDSIMRMCEERWGQAVSMFDLSSTRTRPESVLTDFLVDSWGAIASSGPTPFVADVAAYMAKGALPRIVGTARMQRPGAKDYYEGIVDGWLADEGPRVRAAYQDFCAGALDEEGYLGTVPDSMASWEAERNLERARRCRSVAETVKSSDAAAKAQVKFGTVHSVKGLEFDHVLFVWDSSYDYRDEAKRVMYVALTRARKDEAVISLLREDPNGTVESVPAADLKASMALCA